MTTIKDLRVRVAALVDDVPDEEVPTMLRLLAQAGADLDVRLRARAALCTEALPPDPDQMMTVPEAAKLAAVSPSYVKAHIRTGRLPSVVLPPTTTGTRVPRQRGEGKARRIRRADLLRFLRESSVAA